MSNMQIPIRFGWKPGHDSPTRSFEMILLVLLLDLGIAARGVQFGEKSLGEEGGRVVGFGGVGRNGFGGGRDFGSGFSSSL